MRVSYVGILIYESPFGVTTMVELKLNVFRSSAVLFCALLLVSRVSIVTAADAPELPKPNSELQPGEIVEIVINALAKNVAEEIRPDALV